MSVIIVKPIGKKINRKIFEVCENIAKEKFSGWGFAYWNHRNKSVTFQKGNLNIIMLQSIIKKLDVHRNDILVIHIRNKQTREKTEDHKNCQPILVNDKDIQRCDVLASNLTDDDNVVFHDGDISSLYNYSLNSGLSDTYLFSKHFLARKEVLSSLMDYFFVHNRLPTSEDVSNKKALGDKIAIFDYSKFIVLNKKGLFISPKISTIGQNGSWFVDGHGIWFSNTKHLN